MMVQCPMCNSADTIVTESRSKARNEEIRSFNTDDIPRSMRALDYRLRRHRCKTCGYTFVTIETYFDEIDIKNLYKNVLKGL